MKVFTDLHHIDLYYALHCLFEKRLGWELYRPIGLDWFYQKYWKLGDLHNDQQYINFMLEPGGVMDKPWIPGWNYKEDGVYYLFDSSHEYYHKALTLDQFKAMDIDLIVSSVEVHELPFKMLRDRYHPKAKLLAHLGNFGQKSSYSNIIYSTPSIIPDDKHSLLLHQELDTRFFQYQPSAIETKNIFSIVHFHPYPEIYEKFSKLLSGVQMKSYGGQCPNGGLFGIRNVANKMREANIGWHLKPFGGLGHTSMGWFASGRPVITNMSQHRLTGGDALALFEPGVTCLDIEAFSTEDMVKQIYSLLEPDNNLKMGQQARNRLWSLINYDEEESSARRFLGDLL